MSATTRGFTRRQGPPWLPYLLTLPTALVVLVFTAWPTVQALYMSFFRQYLNIAKFRTPTFIGLKNYQTLATSPDFHQVLRNTAIYVLGTVPMSVVLAFLFALLVNRAVKGIGLARLGFFYPTILPMVSAATIWLFFFTPDYGLFNTALQAIGYHGPQNWLSNPHLALLAVMIVAVWKNAGYLMIFYLAGLQNLPTDVFEAADIDGASAWTKLWKITFPLLRRTTLFVSTIAIIDAFQVVDHIFVLTQGGPSGASNVFLYYLWQVRFEEQNVGLASALTVVLILIMLAITVTNFVYSEREGA